MESSRNIKEEPKMIAITTNDGNCTILELSPAGEVYATIKNQGSATVSKKFHEFSSVSGVWICGRFGDTLAYTSNGKLYVWGTNVHRSPEVVLYLKNLPYIIDARCIAGHYLALADNGKIYEWRGSKTFHHNSNALKTTPTVVELSEVIAIACGPNHSLAVTKYRDIYSFGINVWSKGGLLHQPVTKIPLEGETVAKVACGLYHSLVLTKSGKIYTWGQNDYGLGDDGNNEESDIPLQVGGNIGRFVDINTNGFQTNVAETDSRAFYVWGLCEEGNRVVKPTLTEHGLRILYTVGDSSFRHRSQRENRYCVTEEYLGKAMTTTFNVKDFSDFTLYVDDKPIYAHKYVLRLRSEFFRTLLQEHWTDKETSHLELKSYDYDVYLSYLWYLYSGEIKTSDDCIIGLWGLAAEYREEKLKKRCEKLIHQYMTTEDLLNKSRKTRPSVTVLESSASLEERMLKIENEYGKQYQRLNDEYLNTLERLKNGYKKLQEKDAEQFEDLSAFLESEGLKTEHEVNKLKLKVENLEQDFRKSEQKYLELETKNSELRKLKNELEEKNSKLEGEISKLKSDQTNINMANMKLEWVYSNLQQAIKIADENTTSDVAIKTQTCQSKIKVNDRAERDHFKAEEIPIKRQRLFENQEDVLAKFDYLYTKMEKQKLNLEEDFIKLREKHQRLAIFLKICIPRYKVNVAAFALGAAQTWSSPTLPKLEDKETSFLWITTDQSSWIASLLSLGTVFGPFAGGYLTSRVGRKWTLNVAVVIILLSYFILLATPLTLAIQQIYLARLLAGFSGGIIYAILPMYVAEVSDDEARASMGTLFAFFLSPGFLLSYSLGPFVSYNVLILVSLIPPILYLIIIMFVPETPYYHVQKGHYEDALESLIWFRKGKSISEVKEELNSIKEAVEEAMRQSGNLKDLLSTRGNRMGLLLSCSLAGFQQLSGINVILFYGETIFNLSGSNLSSSLCTITIGVILLLASAVAAPFARAFGIKKCLIISAIGMAVFQASLALYLLLHNQGMDLSQWDWIPVMSLVCYISIYALGFGPLPWAVMSEVFPSNVKPLGSAVTASFSYIISFVLGKCFTIVDAYVSFFIFSGCCVLALLFTIFLVPDTRGMSFQEIQNLLNKRNVIR